MPLRCTYGRKGSNRADVCGALFALRGTKMKTRNHLFLCCLVMVSLVVLVQGANEATGADRCLVCGMDVARYQHSRAVVESVDGKKFVTCGMQCALTLHLRLGDKWKSTVGLDLLSNRSVNAKEAFYVYKSSVITDMAPGFITFKLKANAEKFAAGFGGQVVTYEEAIAIWKRTD